MTALARHRQASIYLSASGLRTLEECPREFWLRYVRGLPREDLPPAMVLGSAVHAALATFYRSLRDGVAVPDVAAMLVVAAAEIEAAVAGAVPVAFEGGMTADDLVAEAERMLVAFGPLAFVPERVLAVEESFAVQLGDGGEELVGVFDLVVEHEGELWVIDHKVTKRSGVPRSTLEDRQLALYAWAAGELFGNETVRVFHQALVRTKVPKVELVEVPRDERDEVEVGEALTAGFRFVELALASSDPRLLFSRRRNWRCDRCGHREACRNS